MFRPFCKKDGGIVGCFDFYGKNYVDPELLTTGKRFSIDSREQKMYARLMTKYAETVDGATPDMAFLKMIPRNKYGETAQDIAAKKAAAKIKLSLDDVKDSLKKAFYKTASEDDGGLC